MKRRSITWRQLAGFPLLAVMLAITGQLLLGAFSPQLAAAAPPTCYNHDGPTYASIDCDNWVRLVYGRPFADDHCYVVQGAGTTELATSVDACAKATGAVADGTNPNANKVTNALSSSSSAEDPNCKQSGTPSPDQTKACFSHNPIVVDLTFFINALSGLIGVSVVIVIIIGGIQYISAGPNPQTVSAAKKKITNAMIALFSLIFLYAFLQWLVPGGPF